MGTGISRLVALAALLLASGCRTMGVAPAGGPVDRHVDRLALQHVDVIDVVTGTVQRDRTVLIDGNRITAVGPARAISVHAATQVIDARGQYLVPGLWDMHVHAFFEGIDGYLALLVANGVTGFREMGGAEMPLTAIRELRRQVLDGARVAPRFIAAGPLVDGPAARHGENGVVTVVAGSPGRAHVIVDSLAAAGADFIKVYSRLDPEVHAAIVERASARGIDVAGHVPHLMRATDASAAGQRSFEHLIGIENGCSSDENELIEITRRSIEWLEAGDTPTADALERDWRRRVVDTQDASRCMRLYEALRRHDTWQVPTLLLCDQDAGRDTSRMRYLPAFMEEFWLATRAEKLGADAASERALCRLRAGQVEAMARAGVPLLAGSDAGWPGSWWGFGLHDELALLVDAGLTPLRALQSATIEPARFLDAADSLGTVAPGSVADLVLLEANPLDDIANIRRITGVILNGRHLDRAALDSLLATAVRPGRRTDASPPTAAETTPPDLVLLDGRIFTGDSTQQWVEALAVEGERISAIGTSAEIAALAGPATLRIELDGRVVIPGINDAHIHSGGLPGHALRLGGSDPSLDVLLDSLRAATRRTAAGEWLRGNIGARILEDPDITRFVLDSVSPEHPVLLLGFLGHGALVNSAALRALSIAETAADPVGGWYRRMPQSDVVDGWLFGYADFAARARLAALRDDSTAVANLRAFAAEAMRFGITSVQDMPPAGVHTTTARLRAAGVPLRWRLIDFPGTTTAPNPPAAGAVADRHRGRALKWILDGTPLERGPLLRQPYADRADWYGRAYFPADSIRAMVAAAARDERQLLLHAGGDSVLALIFAAMRDAAPDSVWQQRRLRIEHGDFLMPDQIAVARERRVVIVQNPAHLTLPPLMAARFGERSGSIQSLRSLVEAGIPLALGSDGPLNPFLNILFATTHPTNPAEALTREQAIHAYTQGSAYAEFREHEKGMLMPGFLADLAVLSDDVFTVAPDALPRITSVLTIIGGRVVQRAEPFPTRAAEQAGSFVITGARVFDGERVLDAADVLVGDGRIVSVSAPSGLPVDVRRIDGAGATLLPGLIDAHTHTSSVVELEQAMRFGVTTVLDLFTRASDMPALRAAAAQRSDVAGFFSAGILATAPGGHGTESNPGIPTVIGPEAAAAFVAAQVEAGADFLKVVVNGARAAQGMATLDAATVHALVEAGKAHDLLVIAHIETPDDARMAVEAGIDGLAHVWRTPGVPAGLPEFLAERDVFVIPTLAIPGGVDNRARVELVEDAAVRPHLSDAAVATWTRFERDPRMGDDPMQILAYHLRSVAALDSAGVTLLAGSDPPTFGVIHGIGLLYELELLVRAGLTPAEALSAATARTADAFRLTDRGRIRAGQRADMVLVDGDPTTDVTALRRIRHVWRGGVELARHHGSDQ